jgi:hypothetical protein
MLLAPTSRATLCVAMTEFDGRDRIGSALRALAADLVAEKRRVAALRRENRQLKAELDALRRLRDDPAAKRAVREDGPIQSAIPQRIFLPRRDRRFPTGRSASLSRAG